LAHSLGSLGFRLRGGQKSLATSKLVARGALDGKC